MMPTFTDPVLDGRVAVVTGGGSGIGRALARALAERGASVWINGRREEPLAETASANPSRIRWLRGDVTEASGCGPLVEAIGREFGALHLLVNNAAILGPVARLEHCSPEAFDDVMKVNVSGLYRMTYALLPLLRAGAPGASIINLSSGVGRRGRGTWGAYAASKFAVEGLTQVWADEFRGEGIAVNAVNPGGTATAMRAAAVPDEDPSTLPSPGDVVPSFLYLLSPEALAQGLSGVSIDSRDFQ